MAAGVTWGRRSHQFQHGTPASILKRALGLLCGGGWRRVGGPAVVQGELGMWSDHTSAVSRAGPANRTGRKKAHLKNFPSTKANVYQARCFFPLQSTSVALIAFSGARQQSQN